MTVAVAQSGPGLGLHADFPDLADDHHTQYVLVDGTRAMTGGLQISAAAPSVTFTDTDTGEDDWSIVADGDSLTISNIDSDDDGEIVLDHHISLFPTGPTLPLPVFTSDSVIRHTATIDPGGAVNGYFILNDSATVSLSGAFSSYGCVSEVASVTGTSTATTVAAYVFVNGMTLGATFGNRPPVIHSFDHKPLVTNSVATIGCPEVVALNDWTNVETSGTGQTVLDRWVTVRATQFSPYYYHLNSSGVGSSVTVTDRIGFEMGEVEFQAGGGTEQIINQYGTLLYAVSNVTTLNVGHWVEAMTGATENFGIVLDSDGGAGKANGGGGIWFGDGQDATVYYDGSNLIVDPDVVGAGRVYIGATGDDDLLLNDIEIDGDLNHDGSLAGFFNTAPAAQPADIGALTLTTHSGTPNTTLVDVSGTGDDATINDNLHELGLQINGLRTAIRSLGLMA